MSRPQIIQLTLESMADWNVDIADIIEPYINQLEQECDERDAEVTLTRAITAEYLEQNLMDLGYRDAALECNRIAKDYRIDHTHFLNNLRQKTQEQTNG